MLKPISKKIVRRKVQSGKFGIVASRYNARYVEGMLRAARKILEGNRGVLEVYRVPGAFEIPVVAAKLASRTQDPFAAVVCLGVIIRGETTHAQHIGEAVSQALATIQVQYQVPIIHEVLLLENLEQAEVRCLGAKHNRGAEAALTALEMARTMASIKPDTK